MDRKFWAVRGKKQIGPCATREQAVDTFRDTFPFAGPAYQAKARKNQIATGYGEFGPHFDIRWFDAR